MRPVRILIACGSGIATSTVAQERVKEILADEGIKAVITKGTVGQLPALQDSVDVIFLTTRYNKPVSKPVVSVFGLISGINEEQTIADVVGACRTVLAQNSEG
jgi:galactitol PTS system EIIB component